MKPLLVLPLLAALGLGGCATQEYVRQEVGQQDERVKGMESWFKAINQGLDTQAKRIRDAEGRMDQLDQSAASTAARLDDTRKTVGDAGQRVASLEKELGAAQQRIEGHQARLDASSGRMATTVAGLAMAEKRITALENAAVVTIPTPSTGKAEGEAAAAPAVAGAGQAATTAAEAVPGKPDAMHGQIAELNRKIEQQNAALAAAIERLAKLEAGSAAPGQAKAEPATNQETTQKLADLQSELARVRGQNEGIGQNVARLDQRVSAMDAELASARKRVEAGEKVLAESGLRLTMVQDLVNSQGQRLERSETEQGKLSSTAREALERAMRAGKLAEGKLVYETTLTDEVANFAVQEAALNENARKQLSAFADRLKAENRGAFIEIQGHTDSVGSAEANLRLSRKRAMAVRDYLHQEAKIPLHLLAVVAYGETRPVADNGAPEGRAKNRRVVLVVLQ